MEVETSLPSPEHSQWVEMCNRKIPRSVVCHLLQLLDRRSLAAMAQVSRTFRQMTNDPTVFNSAASYSGPNTGLPHLQKVVPFPPPALVGTTLPSVTTVTTAPKSATKVPADTSVFMPVLPEAVPMFAQVPDVVVAPRQVTGGSQKVQISQVLPGYAPSYATDYVPPEVNGHSFSAFANTISFNVSRYPTLSEVVDSKAYTKRKSSGDSRPPSTEPPEVSKASTTTTETISSRPVQTTTRSRSVLEYVPAEYFRGESSLYGPPTMSVYCASRVDFVKPDVLASGRLLTNMTSQAVNSTSSSLDDPLGVITTAAESLETNTTMASSYKPIKNGGGNAGV